MRREGFELAVTPPQVIMIPDPKNAKKMLEPFEEVEIEVAMDFTSLIIEKMNNRKGVLMTADNLTEDK
jgi:GTP-binding protein